jgi:hypothetical protein
MPSASSSSEMKQVRGLAASLLSRLSTGVLLLCAVPISAGGNT